MEKRLKILMTILIVHLPVIVYSQTNIEKSAEFYTCNCIDSLITKSSIKVSDSLVVKCFYKGTSLAIEDKYLNNGKLKLTGRKFVIISGDLLHYLEQNLYNSCTPYKQYIDINRRELVRFK